MAYEIVEQLGWCLPRHTVVCMASGSLLTKIFKGYRELIDIGLTSKAAFSIHGAQATGCSPISAALQAGLNSVSPVTPQTIAKALAIGAPADGRYALRAMRASHGHAADVTDDEIVEGVRLLAECEGVFTEAAGGVTVSSARKLIAAGIIPTESSVVLCITGNGLKTLDAFHAFANRPREIEPNLGDLESSISTLGL